MAGPDGGRSAIWFGRLMRVAVPFGLASLGWNLFQAYEIATGAESVRPGAVVQILLNWTVAVLLVWQGQQYQRQRCG